jgi:hypothetical protein
MIEIQLTTRSGEFYKELMPWLIERGCRYTFFSGRNIVAFENNEDASAFMLAFGGKRSYFVEEMQQEFIEVAKQERFDRSKIR